MLTNPVSHSMIPNVSDRQIQNNLHMREWLSWWSTTLPRSGPRVRVPYRALLLMMGNFGLQGFPFFYCNVKINYTFLLITRCFFKAFLRICEWGFRLNLLCFHSDPHITDIHQMNGLNFHLSNHFHPLFSIFNFFLYHFGRNSFISAVFTLTFWFSWAIIMKSHPFSPIFLYVKWISIIKWMKSPLSSIYFAHI